MVKKNKGFGIYIAFGVWGFFFIGFVYSPKGKGNAPKEMSSVIKIETLYVKNEIIPTKVKVESIVKDEPVVKSNPNKSKEVEPTAINKEGYRGRSYGYDIRHYNREELKKYLEKNGFRNLNKANIYKMRRIWMAYHYDEMLMNVHILTDFPISMIYSFFIIEATNKGIETNLWRLHANAGGGKAIKGFGTVTYKTREVIKGKSKMINDKFYSAKTTELGITAWARILNSGRYYECKKANYKLPKKALYESICKCVYESGYHTDPKYKFRAEFMTEYWEIKTKNFPIEEF
jgi:hypothetical protein